VVSAFRLGTVGVTAFDAVALGVVALGVVALGVVALGVVALGVVALGEVVWLAEEVKGCTVKRDCWVVSGGGGKRLDVVSDRLVKPGSCPVWGALTMGGGAGFVMIGPGGGGGGELPPGRRWARAGDAAKQQPSATSIKRIAGAGGTAWSLLVNGTVRE
jgi:hypothetical protein